MAFLFIHFDVHSLSPTTPSTIGIRYTSTDLPHLEHLRFTSESNSEGPTVPHSGASRSHILKNPSPPAQAAPNGPTAPRDRLRSISYINNPPSPSPIEVTTNCLILPPFDLQDSISRLHNYNPSAVESRSSPITESRDIRTRIGYILNDPVIQPLLLIDSLSDMGCAVVIHQAQTLDSANAVRNLKQMAVFRDNWGRTPASAAASAARPYSSQEVERNQDRNLCKYLLILPGRVGHRQ
jgi:hypothetical protein